MEAYRAVGTDGGDSEDGRSADAGSSDRFGRRLTIWQVVVVPIVVAFLGLIGVIVPTLWPEGDPEVKPEVEAAPDVPASAPAASPSSDPSPAAGRSDTDSAPGGGNCKASLAGTPKGSDDSIDIEVSYGCPLAAGRHRWIVIELENEGIPPHPEYYFKDEVVGPSPQHFNYGQEPYRQIFYTVVLTSEQNKRMLKVRRADGLTLSLYGGTREADHAFVHPS